MIVTIVGSGTLVPEARRAAPALAVQAGDLQLTVDGGTGTLRRQAELGLDFRGTDALFYSHIHLDHTLDLVSFLFAAAYTPGVTRRAPVRVFGPRGFAAFLDGLRAVAPRWLTGGTAGIEVRELAHGDRLALGPVDVEARELPHAVTDIGLRFTSRGRTFAFTGDASWGDALVPFAAGSDLLVADASGTDLAPRENHLTAREAGRLAREARVGQLVLTHLYPAPDEGSRVAQAAAEYDGPILAAEDGDRFLV